MQNEVLRLVAWIKKTSFFTMQMKAEKTVEQGVPIWNSLCAVMKDTWEFQNATHQLADVNILWSGGKREMSHVFLII